MTADRLQQLLARIDQLNRQDPRTEMAGGVSHPQEFLYAQRVTEWVMRLEPQASEALRIVARGQHLCRWRIPRERYERTRAGYLKWRETLKAFHAQQVAQLMQELGYAPEAIDRVRRIMSKRELATDPDTQTLEDALCLVFLETQFADLRKKTPDETMREVIRKTWQKMSPRGRQAAIELPLNEEDRTFLESVVRSQ